MTSSYDKLSEQLFKAIVFLISFENCDDFLSMPAEVLDESESVIESESRTHAI